jgi:hypothetical protein
MDSKATTTAQGDKLNGLFVRGVVMSSTAKALTGAPSAKYLQAFVTCPSES